MTAVYVIGRPLTLHPRFQASSPCRSSRICEILELLFGRSHIHTACMSFPMQRSSSYRIISKCRPTHCPLFIIPAGVMYAQSSDVGIDGNATFTSNSATDDGGTTRRVLRNASNPVQQLPTTCRSSLLQQCFNVGKRKPQKTRRFFPAA